MAAAREVNHPGLPKREFLPSDEAAEELAVGLITEQIREAERRG